MWRNVFVMLKSLCFDPSACFFEDPEGLIVIVPTARRDKVPGIDLAHFGEKQSFDIASRDTLEQGIDDRGALLVEFVGLIWMPQLPDDFRLDRQIARHKIQLFRDVLIGIDGLINRVERLLQIVLLFVGLGELASGMCDAALVVELRCIGECLVEISAVTYKGENQHDRDRTRDKDGN